MKQNLIKIGSRLLEAREAKNLSQEDVQKLTGIVKGNISNYENDISYPGSEKLFKLSELYGVSTDWILKGANPGETRIKEDNAFYDTNLPLRVPNKELKDHFKTIVDYWEKLDETKKGWVLTQLQVEVIDKLKDMKKKKKKE